MSMPSPVHSASRRLMHRQKRYLRLPRDLIGDESGSEDPVFGAGAAAVCVCGTRLLSMIIMRFDRRAPVLYHLDIMGKWTLTGEQRQDLELVSALDAYGYVGSHTGRRFDSWEKGD